jgi:ribokinase
LARRVHEPAIESISAALKSLRTFAGLTVERLEGTSIDVAALAELDVVEQVAATQRVGTGRAIVMAVRAAAERLDPADRLIVDAALCLRLLADGTIEGADADGLYAADLHQRRRWLEDNWELLHAALDGGRTPPPAPTERALRSEVEVEAFRRLAENLLNLSPLEVATLDVEAGPTDVPRVVVVGAAVMDHVYAVDGFPTAGTVVEAAAFRTVPGGKGLNQAVAAARLGMDVHLAAAVGDDSAGAEIMRFLQAEGVRTDMMKVVPHARTSATAIFVSGPGQVGTVVWDNSVQVALLPNDLLNTAVLDRFAQTDALLLTFEVPTETIDAALAAAFEVETRPRTVVTASPTDPSSQLVHERLRRVDYLVGSRADLEALVPDVPSGADLDHLATQILLLGAGAVCLAEDFDAHLWSERVTSAAPSRPASYSDLPASRDAFAAALALRVHEKQGEPDTADISWAAAAMIAMQGRLGAASSMPRRTEIDRVIAITSSRGSSVA